MTIDPLHRYSNEAERDNHLDDDFKLKRTVWYPWFIETYISTLGVNKKVSGCPYIFKISNRYEKKYYCY